ncbi:unnamed protein product [Hydatigera taeniaeformis]|uniref:Pyr_redox_2 domain-containing protein n=1 Tax=Hydatigena taeniaeformis TaxID=6205 RepID=A0A0R3WK32_HYDTA|nr:unnamed protein product [Hydatigera taeniaeformis]
MIPFSTNSSSNEGSQNFSFKRRFFSKPLSKESIFAIIFGAGVLGVSCGLNLFVNWKSNRYADPSNCPIYEKRPPTALDKSSSKSVECSNDPLLSTKSDRLPPRVKHVIIGAGAAGINAARAIRSVDPLALVLLIAGDTNCGEEEVETGKGKTYPPPYIRPVLSGGLWWRTPERRQVMLDPLGDIRSHSWFYYEPLSFFIEPHEPFIHIPCALNLSIYISSRLSEAEEGGICLLRGNPVVALHPKRHAITLADGQEIQYECCLLATGARPLIVPELGHCSHSGVDLVANKRVTYFRNIADYKHLQSVSDRLHKNGGRVAVLGSNQLACELATSFLEERRLPKEEQDTNSSKDSAAFHVHQFLGFGTLHPMEDILPPILAEAVSAYETSRGVVLLPSTTVVRASLVDPTNPTESQIRLTIQKREEGGIIKEEEDLIVDHVVCAVGNEPRTELGSKAGLEVDPVNGGLLVNSELESRDNIFVAGSAASYWDSELDCRRRVDHISVSEDTGELAGLNMARSVSSPSHEVKDKLAEACVSPEKTYDPLPAARKHQTALWFNIGKGAHYDCVGLVDSKRLATRTVFLEGEESSAVVFYLRPEDNRLMGVLLWNITDELFKDPEYVAPSRINLARSLVAQRLILREDDDVLECARQFDLGGEIAEHYEELRAFIEAKRAEEEASAAAEPSTSGNKETEVTNAVSQIAVKPEDDTVAVVTSDNSSAV